MEEEILEQDIDEDNLEDELKEIEKEEAKEKVKKSTTKKSEETIEDTNETYEAFTQPARLGIVNTISGEVMDFEPGRDEGIVQLGKAILNRLDKIGIASGV